MELKVIFKVIYSATYAHTEKIQEKKYCLANQIMYMKFILNNFTIVSLLVITVSI